MQKISQTLTTALESNVVLQIESPAPYPVAALYYHESGNKDRAIELLELALKSLDGPERIAHDLNSTFYGVAAGFGQLQG
ncbi:hypothetical protein [Mesorhizobium sp. AR02]|uniref:hypothetical protein n=1 Tax=Mesorhizobium sp. AR02 TaxID=2865837 RepID=UPI00296249EE|nr:hypothetical protein [Mesorhizobium sp. AR02]